jgi:gliding motility-associated-like protein
MDQEVIFGTNWCFAAPAFTNPAGIRPSTSLPATGLISSAVAATPGLPYQLASYSANNSLRIPGTGSGTLTLTTPHTAATIYVLAASGSGESPVVVATVTFTDLTVQPFVIAVPDWFGGANAAIAGVSRVNYDNNSVESNATDPRLYQVPLVLAAANTSKLVQSVSFAKVSATAAPVLNVLALTLAQPCSLPTGPVLASPAAVCPGQPVQLSLPGAGAGFGYVGQWQASTTNGTTWTSIAGATATSLTVAPLVSTSYRFQAACGTQQVFLGPIAVGVNATPASILYSQAAICGNAASLPGPAVAPTGGTFAAPAGLSINPTTGVVTPGTSTPGTYTVTYTPAGPCNTPATAPLTILPGPAVTLAFNGPAFCKAGAAPVATATPTGGVFSGAPGLVISPGTGAIDLDNSANGTYAVTYTTTGSCAGQATASLTVQGNKAPAYPTVLTPNGDKRNDNLTLKINDVQGYSLKVFNRWGRLVYEGHNANEGWDAATNSGGTYYYLVDYTDCAGRTQHERRWIDVIK